MPISFLHIFIITGYFGEDIVNLERLGLFRAEEKIVS